jgi:hypothetical protein
LKTIDKYIVSDKLRRARCPVLRSDRGEFVLRSDRVEFHVYSVGPSI